MAAGDYRIGLDGKFYSGTAGTTASTERDNVDEVSLGLSTRTAEALRRGKTWVATVVIALEGTLTFKVFDIDSDAFVTVLRTAYMGKSRVALFPKDAATGEGLDADFYITGFTRDESNADIIAYNVEAKPTDELRDPAWS